jgi:hypothetical protein
MRKLRFETGTIILLVLATCAGGIGYAKTVDGVLGGIVLNAKGAPVNAAEIFWQTADGKAPRAPTPADDFASPEFARDFTTCARKRRE